MIGVVSAIEQRRWERMRAALVNRYPHLATVTDDELAEFYTQQQVDLRPVYTLPATPDPLPYCTYEVVDVLPVDRYVDTCPCGERYFWSYQMSFIEATDACTWAAEHKQHGYQIVI